MFNKINRKKILKHSVVEDRYPMLQPMKSFIPKWYKNAKKFETEKISDKVTIKGCIPFLDSMITGYAISLSVDVLVSYENDSVLITWRDGSKNMVDTRSPSTMQNIPIPAGYDEQVFTWSVTTVFDVPQGYSALITHPLNRFDLPFITTSGIVDSGILFDGSLPFFIKKGFEGIIEKGTPIAQVIPFKRESWRLEKDDSLKERAKEEKSISQDIMVGWYKKNRWVMKNFE